MLKKEVLIANAVLANLTPEQITAIEQLSKNDEDSVISLQRKGWWDKLDEDVAAVFGEEKPGGEKSHENHKKWLIAVKTKADKAGNTSELQKQIDDLTTAKTALEAKIAAGSSDEALKTQLADLKQTIIDKDNLIAQTKTSTDKEKADLTKQLNDVQSRSVSLETNNAINSHITAKKIAFKTTIPEEVRTQIMKTERAAMLAEVTLDQIDDGAGGKRTVYRDSKGMILNNPENGLAPFTAGELFLNRPSIKAMIDGGKTQKGGGSSAGAGGGAGGGNLDLTGANTQVKADEIIVNHILKVEGIGKTDPKFASRQKELRTENNVADLPIRESEAS